MECNRDCTISILVAKGLEIYMPFQITMSWTQNIVRFPPMHCKNGWTIADSVRKVRIENE